MIMSPAKAPADPRREHRAAMKRIQDLLQPKPWIYWTDLLASTAVGWGCFAAACLAKPMSVGMFAFATAAVFALYRASIFIHELTHLKPDALPGFRAAWNLLMGYPLLLPSVMYEGVHDLHHRVDAFGTARDPEYVLIRGKPLRIVAFAIASLAIPALLVVRFLIAGPLGLICPPFQRWLERIGSSFTISPTFQRTVTPAEHRELLIVQLWILLYWGSAASAVAAGWFPARAFWLWMGVFAGVCFVNQLRTIIAHRYESEGHAQDRLGQLHDSIDVPGGWLTELWAPIGLRYHAMHHAMPNMPYHNLGVAYRRLCQELPPKAGYRQYTTPSVWRSFSELWRGSERP